MAGLVHPLELVRGAWSSSGFPPGAALDRVEIHDEEHGLFVTEGTGRYLLDRAEHDVRAGDFVYIGPYCPQSFVASGDATAEYLLYKDVFRSGFGEPAAG